MSVLQIVDDWHNGRMNGLNVAVSARLKLLRDAKKALEALEQEKNCPERQCSLQRPGQRSLEVISSEMAAVRARIKRLNKRALRAVKRRDKVQARRQLVNRFVYSFAVHQ
jgi:hypothetical protein